jgi:hypothetical protein
LLVASSRLVSQLYLIVVSYKYCSRLIGDCCWRFYRLSLPQLYLIVVSCDSVSVSVSVAVACGFIVAPDGSFNSPAAVAAVKLHNRRWQHEQVR